MSAADRVDGIAIIGMAGRFPGAPDVDTLWSNLCHGVESVRSFSEEELRAAGADTSDPAFVNAGAALDGIEDFDARFFGMSRREAELTDPQHRVLLETAWTVLEHAGYDPEGVAARIGIYGGVAEDEYLRKNLLAHPELLARFGHYPVLIATAREYAITRIAFKLGLTGPAVSVITACSTSAVAVHLAVQSLLAGDSDLALAGGAHIRLPIASGYVFQEDGIFSADGHVRPFDADARGTVMTSGVAMIALKRLAEALEDGDTIYAVIRGSAINNDGAARIGFTAPSIDGQRTVIEDALAVADAEADSIGMVEAHGTGTSLGDPIEFMALTQAYRRYTDRRQYCAIGSLKANVGHLDAAAGVAGVIKAALSLYHERIPPTINFQSPNPQIDFGSSPFFVNTELREWKRTDEPRRAGVSCFGFGGTNAHIVLEEAPKPLALPAGDTKAPLILTLSAKTVEALEQRKQDLADHLASRPEIDLADVAHTLALGRSRMPHRTAVIADDAASAVALLRHPDRLKTATRTSAATGADVAFLFTGYGAQYAGMGAGLYRTEPAFAAALEECACIVGDIDGHDLVDLLYGSRKGEPTAAADRLMQLAVGQPAIFALQYALARLWASWGVTPTAVVGHSVGEFAAACIGGVFRLEDALTLIVARGRLMQDLPVGAMTAVVAEESAVLPFLDAQTSLAAVNAPEQCVASGPPASIDELERRLTAAGLPFRHLPIDRAAHSPIMAPMVEPLRDHVARIARGELRIPMVSTMTGAWVTTSEITDPDYWGQHARRTVRFMDAVGVLLTERPGTLLLEIGPGETLASLVREHPAVTPDSVVISALPHRGAERDDVTHARRALADAWAAGIDVGWKAVNGDSRRRVPLPTYPFARDRHWIEGRIDVPKPTSADLVPLVEAAASAVAARTAPSLDDAVPASGAARRERIVGQLTEIITDLCGLDAADVDAAASFTDLGFDSLFLTQANAQVRKQFGVRVTLRQLLSEVPTIDALAEHIDSVLGADAILAPARSSQGLEPSPDAFTTEDTERMQAALIPPEGADAATDPVRWLISEQLRLMERQLDLMRAHVTGSGQAMDGPSGLADTSSRATPITARSIEVPVLPNVARFMNERETPHPERWNLGVMLTPARRLRPESVRQVVAALSERHDALRLRFQRVGPGCASSIAPATDPPPFATSDLSGVAPMDRSSAVERRADELERSLDLEHGPLFRVELFDLGEQGQRLLVIVHHFVMDQLAWPTFWEDFETLYAGLERHAAIALPPPTTSFEDWARSLQRYADSDVLRAEVPIWLDLPWEHIRPIPLDHPDGANTNASAAHIELVLSSEQTNALLRRTPGVIRKADLILTALARVTARWTGSDTALIDMMGHGRDDGIVDGVDPYATVGFFISYTPMVLRLPDASSGLAPPPLTDQIEPLMRRALDFDLLRCMTSDASIRDAFRDLPKAQILFNHHGQRDEPDEAPRSAVFAMAPESIGGTHSPEGIRYYPIAVSSEIHRGQLRLNFVYSANLHERSTIASLTDEFMAELGEIISRAAI